MLRVSEFSSLLNLLLFNLSSGELANRTTITVGFIFKSRLIQILNLRINKN